MSTSSRRAFVTGLGVMGLQPIVAPFAGAQASAKVVIVGGGAGGATLAHVLKTEAPGLDVTLIEATPIYSSCFFSNRYIAGLRKLESLHHSYVGLSRLGIKVVHDVAVDTDVRRRIVRTKGGRSYPYDRLVIASGVEIQYDSVPGYSRELARAMPHAYITAAHDKRILKHQLKALRDGGVVVICAPGDPSRCPEAPYERACMIAHHLKARKPRSKLIVLDPKRAFPMQAAFKEAFATYYKGIVELHQSSDADDFAVARVDPRSRVLGTRSGLRVRADVANIIPMQRAGEFAARTGCRDGNWCPVEPGSFASRRVPNVFVIGDAAEAPDMPKTAYSANAQAKLVAAELLAALAGLERVAPPARDVGWSLVAPNDCVTRGATYELRARRLGAVAPFASEPGEAHEVRQQNVTDSNAWYDAITAEMFARHKRDGAFLARKT